MDQQPEQIAVACALLQYLLAHPHACDDAHGIQRWWLACPLLPMDSLTDVLDRMSNQGLIDVQASADGRLRYRRAAGNTRLQAALLELHRLRARQPRP
jgi:hypothetical protein